KLYLLLTNSYEGLPNTNRNTNLYPLWCQPIVLHLHYRSDTYECNQEEYDIQGGLTPCLFFCRDIPYVGPPLDAITILVQEDDWLSSFGWINGIRMRATAIGCFIPSMVLFDCLTFQCHKRTTTITTTLLNSKRNQIEATRQTLSSGTITSSLFVRNGGNQDVGLWIWSILWQCNHTMLTRRPRIRSRRFRSTSTATVDAVMSAACHRMCLAGNIRHPTIDCLGSIRSLW